MEWSWMVVLLCAASASCVELKTRKGDIQGTEETSRNGRTYYAFRGIPYAQPPIGRLRFRNPQPHIGWKGILDATEYAPICMQKYIFVPGLRNITQGQEDCLFLNIYTPTIDIKKNLPVMVYIHGGGFRCGKPGPREAPAFFMDEDVILVTVHYRVGTLGFLSTEDRLIPGNFGLKDQAMAIKWLSENINDYGGNPDSIVVFGESAGGASAHYLITSPLSRDYLKAGISQSGVIDAPWALSPVGQAKQISDKLANIVGCSSSPLLECLQSVEADKLIAAELDFLEWDFDPAVVFQPVIEEENEGAFMTEDPRKIKNTVPWITGFVNGEGLLKTSSLVNQDDSVIDYFVNNIDKILPSMLFVKPGTPGLDQLIFTVKNKYFKNLSDRKQVVRQHEDFYHELYFVYPMELALKRHSGPKYAYLLSHKAEKTLANIMGPNKGSSTKACHSDELFSLFDWSSVFPDSKGTPEDRKVSELFVKLWVNFGKSRNPTLEGVQTKWHQYADSNFLHIQTNEAEMEKILIHDVVDFWSRAFDALKTAQERLKEEL